MPRSRSSGGDTVAIETLDTAHYGGDQAFRREQADVLRRAWRLVGHEGMIAEPGDYLSDVIGGAPVLVVRGTDGEIRGFHNVCRHRAGPLTDGFAGNCGPEIVCRYHGWRYTLDGRLRSAVDFGPAEGFDPRDFGLFPARVALWRGFVFVNLDADATPLMETLAPLDALWAERGFETAPFTLRRTHDIACNWKTYVENYLEGYHIAHIHPGLSAEIETAAYTVEMRGQVALHQAPQRDGGVSEGLWAWVWPDLGVNVYRHGLMMERMTPVGPGHTRLDYLYFFDPDRQDELQTMLAASDQIALEDKAICERVQVNLDAGVYRQGVLSPRHEGAVAWFQARIRDVHSDDNSIRAKA